MTRWHPFFFAPDYWIFELPFAILSTAWTVTTIRNVNDDSPVPPFWLVVLAGAWMALCFTQKPSLAGLAALPILLGVALPRHRLVGKAIRLVILTLAFIVVHRLVMLASNKFDLALTETANLNYWAFLSGGASYGTSLLDFLPLAQSVGFLLSPVALGLAALCIGVAAAFVSGECRKAAIAAVLLFGIFSAHCMVIRARPSGTSVIDLAIYGAMLVPIAVALLRERRSYVVAGVAGFALAIAAAWPIYLPAQIETAGLATKMDEASAYEKQLDRPVSVVIHDNRAHPLTIEALALYTGQLQPLRTEVKTSLRDAFLGDVDRPPTDAAIQAAISSGRTIVWGSAPNVPLVEEIFPSMKAFKANPRLIEKVIVMSPGSHTAHIAYIK